MRLGRRPRLPQPPDRESAAPQRDRLLEQAAEIPFWWHSIELSEGLVTPGLRTSEALAAELETMRLPNLQGRSVLDVGAWDGFFSFEAERRGAARVVALDHFVWAWDRAVAPPPGPDGEPLRSAAGRRMAQDETPACWDPVGLPGKRPFDLAHRALESSVQPVVLDFVNDDIDFLGRFDVVLFLGILYHMKDPFGSLRRLAQVTGETAVIETEARVFPGSQETPLCEFFAGHRLDDDPTNWWAPNEAALRLMLLEAGFDSVEILIAAPEPPPSATEPLRYRTIAHAHKAAAEPGIATR